MIITKDQLYIYDLPDPLIESLELVHFDNNTNNTVQDTVRTTKPISDKTKAADTDDFTKYNELRQSRGLKTLTEQEFDELLERGSIESLSGSESEADLDDEDELYKRIDEFKIDEIDLQSTNTFLNSKTPKVYFKSKLIPDSKNLGIYKSFLGEEKIDPLKAVKSWQKSEKNGKSALFMIGGGHFAGAIISHSRKNIKGDVSNKKETIEEQKLQILKSKTFHRYTTRRKQGGSQSANDNAKGKAKSVGSNMRRENEKLLIRDVRELLKTWQHDLNDCKSIFIRANGSNNRKTLIGYEGSVLKNDDKRIKSFPFTTKRPTTLELKKAWVQLSYLQIEDEVQVDNDEELKRKQQDELLKKSQQQKEHEAPKELSESDKHTKELVQFLKKSKAPMLINYLKKHGLSPDFKLTPVSVYKQTPTLLHYATSQGFNYMIQILLSTLKADPTIKSDLGKYPSELTSNLQTKQSYQICRYELGEDYCDWDAIKVGKAKSKQECEVEQQQEEERIRLEKQTKIKELLDNKTEMELRQPRFQGKGKLGGGLISETSGLTEQQKMMLMREQRARAAEARLKNMK